MKHFKRIKHFLKKIRIKDKASISVIISMLALFTSALNTYFQFFNCKHSILFAVLEPQINKNLEIPLIFKNDGNQTDIILKVELFLEARCDTGSFYKKIDIERPNAFPVILSPKENRYIKIIGNYKNYLFGTILIDNKKHSMIYQPITQFDNLNLLLKITYLNEYGETVADEQAIEQISFDKRGHIIKANCCPIKLTSLKFYRNEYEVVGDYIILPNVIYHDSANIDLKDPASVAKNINKILLLNKILEKK